MKNNLIKTILTGIILVILFVIALKVLKFAIAVLLPLAIIIVAAYIVYNLFVRRK